MGREKDLLQPLRGPLGMRVEYLRQCMEEAMDVDMDTERLNTSKRWKVVDLVQTAFRDERLAGEVIWQEVVLILKGYGNFRVIWIWGVL